MSRLRSLSGAAMAFVLAAPLFAQETPAPSQERILPPIRYSLPPGEGSEAQTPPPVVTTQPPVVAPTATPTPAATPTPRATPSAAPGRTPTPRPSPTAAATPAPSPTPTPQPSATSEPATTPQSGATETAPVTEPAVAAPATVEAPVIPTATTDGAGGNGWLIALGGLLVAAAAGFLWWRRKASGGSAPVDTEAPDVPEAESAPPSSPKAEEPAVPAAPTAPVLKSPPRRPVAPPKPADDDEPQFLSRPAGPPMGPRAPIPAGTITAFRDRPKPASEGFITAFKRPAPSLGIELQPIRAGTGDDTGFVEFQFAFVNASDQAVGNMMVSAWMLTANADQDAQIAAYLGEPADPAQHTLYALQPGEHREHRATMGEGFEHLHIVEAAGRRFFAPIIVIDARYRGQGGGEGRSSAAFVVGRPNPATGKLLPIYVDRGARIVEGLAARPYPLPRIRAA